MLPGGGRSTTGQARHGGQAGRQTAAASRGPRHADVACLSGPFQRADSVVKERFFDPRQEGRLQLHRGQVDRSQKSLQGVLGVDFFRTAQNGRNGQDP